MSGLNLTTQQTTNAQGMFTTSSDGLVVGTAMPDPDRIWRLQGGILAATETEPMFGGLGLYMDVPGGAGHPRCTRRYT